MRIVKILAGVAVVLLLLIGGVAIYIANLDANEYRGVIEQAAKDATGRDLTIAGDMDFAVSFTPALVVEDVALSNAEWASAEKMVRLKRLEVQVGLLPLLSGNIDVHRVVLNAPEIMLETDKNGRGNWEFQTAKADTAAPSDSGAAGDSGSAATALPSIGEIRIEGGRVHFKDGASGQETIVGPVDLTGRAESPNDPLELSLNAVVNEIPISLVGQVGPLTALLGGDRRADLDLTLEALGMKILANGSMAAPQVDVAIDVSASDLAELRTLAGDAVPTGQSLKLTGQVSAGPEAVKLSGLSLTLGDSDLTGDATISLTGPRPRIDAKLQSRQLNIAALLPPGADDGGATSGQGGAGGGGGSGSNKVFPNDPLPLDGMKAVDANVEISVDKAILPNLTLNASVASIALKDGKLDLKPVRTNVAGSPVETSVALNASRDTPTLAFNLMAEKFDFGEALKQTGTTDLLEGNGDIAVDVNGRGQSVAAIMASLNGSTNVLMGQGRMRTQAFDTLVGGLSSVMGKLFSDKSEWTVVNCAANRFAIKDGVATSQVMLFDTEYSTVVGKGDVNLGKETLALVVTPQSKSPTLNLSVPIKVGGTFAEPSFAPDELAVARRVGGLLGSTLFPPAALLSLGDLGTGEDNPCLKIASGEQKPAGAQESAPSPVDDAKKALEDPKKAIEGAGNALKKLFGN